MDDRTQDEQVHEDEPSQVPTELADSAAVATQEFEEPGSPEPIDWPPSPTHDSSAIEVVAS